MYKKILSLLIVFVITLSTLTSYAVTREEVSKWNYINVSDWAREELVDAVSNGLVLDSALFKDCKKNITRQEFSTLAVNLYTSIKKEDPAPAPYETFSDTGDLSVRIAYNLGIIKGVGNGKFAPDSFITREQMGVIMLNAVNALGVKYKSGDGVLAITDKANVSAWAVDGVDFVYENSFMKGDGIKFNPSETTPVEQAVAIVNRVYKEYVEPVITEKDDYQKGYAAKNENDGLYIQFNNTGNKKAIVKYGVAFNPVNDSSISLLKASDVKISNDYEKIYFMDEVSRIISYDFKTEKYYNYEKDFGLSSVFSIIETGKYKGYFLVRQKATNGNIIAYDQKLKEVGIVYDLDPYTAQGYIDEAYETKAKAEMESDIFKFVVDGKDYKKMETFGGEWEHKSTLSMRPNMDNSGPLALINTDHGFNLVYNDTGMYKTSFKFNNENNSNAGIVFNVKAANYGNDQYTGYYVGLNPERDSVMIGWSANEWHKIKEVNLDFDVKKGETYELMVLDGASKMTVYVNGKEYMSVSDNNIGSNGYIGLRGYNADVDYISFSAQAMPY